MRGKPFEPGNKVGKGRPAGSRNKKSIFRETLEDVGVPLIKKGALLALNGDRFLLRVCMDKLISSAQPPPTRFRLPKNQGEPDMKKLLESILKQTSKGSLSPREAVDVGTLAEIYTRTREDMEHERRLAAVENHDLEDAA
jgi:hypothetical protein